MDHKTLVCHQNVFMCVPEVYRATILYIRAIILRPARPAEPFWHAIRESVDSLYIGMTRVKSHVIRVQND